MINVGYASATTDAWATFLPKILDRKSTISPNPHRSTYVYKPTSSKIFCSVFFRLFPRKVIFTFVKNFLVSIIDLVILQINDDDNFPRNICHVCLYKLDMWYDFKKQFVRSNVMLREHLELSELSDNAVSRRSA